jgi:hypothetical protein
MIEIIVIWRLAVYAANKAGEKGLKKPRYVIMGILLWICGELLGAFLGAMIMTNSTPLAPYGMALLGAFAGMGITILIMHNLPEQQDVISTAESESKPGTSFIHKFGRSVWVPMLAALLAVSCMCLTYAGAVIFRLMRDTQQAQASQPIIGIEIDDSGQITEPVTAVSTKEDVIYFGFNFDIPPDQEMTVAIDWFVDGNMAYSTTESLESGPVTVAFDRTKSGLPEFAEGHYAVQASIMGKFLTSASFVVINTAPDSSSS